MSLISSLFQQKNKSDSYLPGSDGEHALQRKFNTTDRANTFYQKMMLDHLNDEAKEFIPQQEIMFISTADKHGDCDCSARFGDPGFITVLDDKHLIYPEFQGNGVMASLGNIAENPHIGIIVFDFYKTSSGWHVNGKASIIENEDLVSLDLNVPQELLKTLTINGRRRPTRWVLVEVEESYWHCPKQAPKMFKI